MKGKNVDERRRRLYGLLVPPECHRLVFFLRNSMVAKKHVIHKEYTGNALVEFKRRKQSVQAIFKNSISKVQEREETYLLYDLHQLFEFLENIPRSEYFDATLFYAVITFYGKAFAKFEKIKSKFCSRFPNDNEYEESSNSKIEIGNTNNTQKYADTLVTSLNMFVSLCNHYKARHLNPRGEITDCDQSLIELGKQFHISLIINEEIRNSFLKVLKFKSFTIFQLFDNFMGMSKEEIFLALLYPSDRFSRVLPLDRTPLKKIDSSLLVEYALSYLGFQDVNMGTLTDLKTELQSGLLPLSSVYCCLLMYQLYFIGQTGFANPRLLQLKKPTTQIYCWILVAQMLELENYPLVIKHEKLGDFASKYINLVALESQDTDNINSLLIPKPHNVHNIKINPWLARAYKNLFEKDIKQQYDTFEKNHSYKKVFKETLSSYHERNEVVPNARFSVPLDINFDSIMFQSLIFRLRYFFYYTPLENKTFAALAGKTFLICKNYPLLTGNKYAFTWKKLLDTKVEEIKPLTRHEVYSDIKDEVVYECEALINKWIETRSIKKCHSFFNENMSILKVKILTCYTQVLLIENNIFFK